MASHCPVVAAVQAERAADAAWRHVHLDVAVVVAGRRAVRIEGVGGRGELVQTPFGYPSDLV